MLKVEVARGYRLVENRYFSKHLKEFIVFLVAKNQRAVRQEKWTIPLDLVGSKWSQSFLICSLTPYSIWFVPSPKRMTAPSPGSLSFLPLPLTANLFMIIVGQQNFHNRED